MNRHLSVALTALAITSAGGAVVVAPAQAAPRPAWTKNCTELNKKYPHGVGKAKAVDKTSKKRVTNFRRSDKIYAEAMRWNKGLDRDKDGIACEKK